MKNMLWVVTGQPPASRSRLIAVNDIFHGGERKVRGLHAYGFAAVNHHDVSSTGAIVASSLTNLSVQVLPPL